MTDHVAAWKVDPDAGFVVGRRAGYQDELIAGLKAIEVRRPLAEDGAVHGGAEAAGTISGERRPAHVSR
jgi:hypothetical protein